LTLECFYYPPHFAQLMNFPTKGKETCRQSNELRTHERREYKKRGTFLIKDKIMKVNLRIKKLRA